MTSRAGGNTTTQSISVGGNVTASRYGFSWSRVNPSTINAQSAAIDTPMSIGLMDRYAETLSKSNESYGIVLDLQ